MDPASPLFAIFLTGADFAPELFCVSQRQYPISARIVSGRDVSSLFTESPA